MCRLLRPWPGKQNASDQGKGKRGKGEEEVGRLGEGEDGEQSVVSGGRGGEGRWEEHG